MEEKKNSARAVVLGVTALVVVTLAGLGFYAYKNPTFSLYGKNDENKPRVTVPTTTSTIAIATSTPANEDTDTEPRSTGTARRQVASVNQAFSGPAYRNPTFGLTVPGTYQVVPTQNFYAGVSTSASYNFYQGGVHAFTINVFSKEQWNNIRIQETIGVKEGTGPDYLGEGRYLGENMTWIYSYIPGASLPPAGVRFF